MTTDPAQSNTTTPALSKEQQRTARPYEKAKNKTLRDIDRMSRSAAREIGVGFAALNNLPPEDHEAFYRCLGDRVRTKSPDLSLHEVMGWCLDEYTHDRDAFLRERASYDYFAVKEQFSLWDGSHRPTVEFIKANMHDPSSFKHVETKYSIQTYNTPPDMIVLTTFRGSNLFGALVTNTWKVRVDLETGKVIEVID